MQLEKVILGSLEPGEKLPSERVLVQKLEVSRIVIREAMKLLAERGLINIQAGVGSFVKRIGGSTVTRPLQLYIDQNRVSSDNLFQLRFVLETAIALAAAENAQESELTAMQETLARTEEVVEVLEVGSSTPELLEQFAWIDFEFHQQLARASGNPLFEIIVHPLIDSLLQVRRQGVAVGGTARRAFEDHVAIFQQVEARDPQGAQNAMKEHLSRVMTWVQALSEEELF